MSEKGRTQIETTDTQGNPKTVEVLSNERKEITKGVTQVGGKQSKGVKIVEQRPGS